MKTQLVRVWRGTTHTVEVLDGGYQWQGQTYRSLSEIARLITGTRWNGLLFFGLRERMRREPVTAKPRSARSTQGSKVAVHG